MINKKTCVFIGNRHQVFQEIKKNTQLQLVRTFVLKGSHLNKLLKPSEPNVTVFDISKKKSVVEQLLKLKFDIFISNGCPFVLPISTIRKEKEMYLNVHPGYLPEFKGLHPANDVLLRESRWAGASMHFMDDGVDTGNVIHRERFAVTRDMDLGMLYYLLFKLEAKVFSAGFKKLIQSDFKYRGIKQVPGGKVYRRSQLDMVINCKQMSTRDLLRKIRAFGIRSQGVECPLGDRHIRVFDAEAVPISSLHGLSGEIPPGKIILEYDGKILVATKDGILKIKSFQ
jgi:methionyl-tRNA formyltransferase